MRWSVFFCLLYFLISFSFPSGGFLCYFVILLPYISTVNSYLLLGTPRGWGWIGRWGGFETEWFGASCAHFTSGEITGLTVLWRGLFWYTFLCFFSHYWASARFLHFSLPCLTVIGYWLGLPFFFPHLINSRTTASVDFGISSGR